MSHAHHFITQVRASLEEDVGISSDDGSTDKEAAGDGVAADGDLLSIMSMSPSYPYVLESPIDDAVAR